MKIAHLSDLHFTTFFKNNNLSDIEYLINYALLQNCDHIVITGDLTDNADSDDFNILRDLFIKYEILKSNRLSLVIGNHDIFGGVQTAEDIFTFPGRCKKVDFHKKVNEFYDCFRETFDNAVHISKEVIFPYAKIVNDVLLIGMNSIAEYSKRKNVFASNGAVGMRQYGEVFEILEKYKWQAESRIVMIHHHFNKMKVDSQDTSASFWQNIEKQTMKLRKKKRLIRMFEHHGIDLVLHGHNHENREYVRKNIRFLNAGGSVKSVQPNTFFVNIIETQKNNIRTEIHKLEPFTSNLIFSENKKQISHDELNAFGALAST